MKKTLTELMKLLHKPARVQKDHAVQNAREERSTQRYYTARSPSQLQGARAEQLAREYLENAGLRYVDSNWASNLGEIDLIMRAGDMWVFVEVKARKNNSYGGAAYAITSSKLMRLRQMVAQYQQAHPQMAQKDCRLDAVLIQGLGENLHIEWIQNIE